MASLNEEQLAAYLELHYPNRQLSWVYGSGIGLGLDISKAIDKANGAERKVVGKRVYANGHIQNSSDDKLAPPIGTFIRTQDKRNITAPSTSLAKQFAGWNTRLKPGYEPVVVARKPIDTTSWIIELTPTLLDKWEADQDYYG
jgi:hypothetical protein